MNQWQAQTTVIHSGDEANPSTAVVSPVADGAAQCERVGGGPVFGRAYGRARSLLARFVRPLPAQTGPAANARRFWRHSLLSLITHPASTISAVQSDAEIAASSVPPGLVRLSVGLEDVADIVDDLAQALGGLPNRSPTK